MSAHQQFEFEELPDYWWAVDPGDRNVGLTKWHRFVCFEAVHTSPADAVDHLIAEITSGGLTLVVYEEFRLRGALMAQQQGSEFLTSQMIGAIRHVCRRAGVTCVGYRPRDHKALFKQREFKPPIRPHVEWASYGHGGHAKDAECLGEFHCRKILKRGQGY